MKFVSSNFLPLHSRKTGDIHKIVLSFHCLRPGIFLGLNWGYSRKGKMDNNCIIQACRLTYFNPLSLHFKRKDTKLCQLHLHNKL